MLPLLLLKDYLKIQFMRQLSLIYLPVSLNTTWNKNAARRVGTDPTVFGNDDDFHFHLAPLSCTERRPMISFPKFWNDLANVPNCHKLHYSEQPYVP
jgi:hypothetical protein